MVALIVYLDNVRRGIYPRSAVYLGEKEQQSMKQAQTDLRLG